MKIIINSGQTLTDVFKVPKERQAELNKVVRDCIKRKYTDAQIVNEITYSLGGASVGEWCALLYSLGFTSGKANLKKTI